MSSAGHVFAMIQSLRNNRNLLKKRDKFFSGFNKRVAKGYRQHTRHDKKMSKEELQTLRLKLIKENKRLLFKKVIVLSISIAFIIVFIIWINKALDLELINNRYGFQE
ncbi:hypothetical protein [Carboxylicivirga sp. M1479]|uniref:hypothetical protein n=1 Tax=Carboxylicivirga sp. M1479 TaxID=2594476 RepID=UPI001177EC58|nr:hypothetical protein [Carboxylicivirga sp. M1479]TRX65829.1 hypothetical protein FNN09_17150 [Carboxylicivirga sp. M1479]